MVFALRFRFLEVSYGEVSDSSLLAKSGTHKSRPTIFSSTELFPLDCEPTTAICGRSMGFWT